ncbi:MAG: hypothetical protein EP329_15415 [Deltaproteobacteria bacterium]|nr:MAG: hypothetical protein EP329_15415 [Deltaproteobacteria bacterium]
MLRILALVGAAALLLPSACSSDPSGTCEENDDCASGVCWPDKTCAPVGADVADAIFVPPDVTPTDTEVAADSASPTDTLAGDTGGAGDTASPTDTAVATDTATGPTCVANSDHVITRGEVPYGVPGSVRFRAAEDVPFDTHPTYGSQGELHWDLARAFEGDADVVVAVTAPGAHWFGADYPDATFVRPLGQASDPEDGLLGIYRDAEDGVYLLGIASPTADGLRTQVTYDPPAKMLAFPIQEGASWETDSQVAGTWKGNPLFATDNWHGAYQLDGTVGTPAGTFPATRVVIGVYRWIGASFYVDVRHLFLVECRGVVGEVQGLDNDGGPELATAELLRRIAP